MPDIADEYVHMAEWSPQQLELRRQELVSASRDTVVDELPMSTLRELAHITSVLRRRSAGPPKKEKKASTKKKAATVADLANLF